MLMDLRRKHQSSNQAITRFKEHHLSGSGKRAERFPELGRTGSADEKADVDQAA